MWIKLAFVLGLYLYHPFSLHRIYSEQMNGIFRFTSNQLRVWNEVATIFLVAIVMLVSGKEQYELCLGVSWVDSFCKSCLMSAIKIYKKIREK